jgi:hypothetical protein
LAATTNATVPFPARLVPSAMVIHGTLLVAVHAQPALAWTVTVPEPPAAAIACVVGVIE